MISVLVTGATTTVGESLVRSLVADTRVRHVLAVAREAPEQAPLFSHGNRLTYLQVDLARSRHVRELLFGPARDLGVEVVVHLNQQDSGFQRGRRTHAANVEALRAMMDLADRHPTIRRLVLKSYAVVYKVSLELPVLVREEHPLNLSPKAPQYIRDRVEADLTACARMGLSSYETVVLRCAEAIGPGTGSQLFDYLDAPIAFRPMGFDPMVNVSTVEDVVCALERATHGSGEGVFNVPGFDTLPLSEAIRKWGTPSLPLPGPLVSKAYTLRHRLTGSKFSYGLNRNRLHLGLVLDGHRAADVLGYTPSHPLDWPVGGPVADPRLPA
ncbi:MAG: NAD-dependent epimerase/dehydratase family protein [Alphaproteobacteria bacterium]|nr:NAD-dependent epimerase/dehydratase family protein [Alphaproteobacteria bacterium]MCB9691214.1 NAD-dependent epimerase/dehydratase family protein [Alphaproteobacteria bacterium]